MKNLLSKLFKKKEQTLDFFEKQSHPNYSKIIYLDNLHQLYKRTMKSVSPDFDYEITNEFIEKEILASRDEEFKYNRIMIYISCNASVYSEDLALIQQFGELAYIIDSDDNKLTIVVSGSIYDYRNMIKTIKDFNNIVFKEILSCLYSLPKCFFIDFINDGVLEERKFDAYPAQLYPSDHYLGHQHLPNLYEILKKINHQFSYYQLRKIIKGIVNLDNNDIHIGNLLDENIYSEFKYDIESVFGDVSAPIEKYYQSLENDTTLYSQIDINTEEYDEIVIFNESCSECGLPLIKDCFESYAEDKVCSKCINKAFKIDDPDLSLKMITLRDKYWNDKETIRKQSDKIDQCFE